jgi:NADPH-dependent glutamate synthase beta subunit-like oxidoreductase
MSSMGIEVTDWGTLKVDEETLATSRPGVFAGGDVITGPNTVVEAIAAGKKAARMMERHLRGEELKEARPDPLPSVYVEPVPVDEDALADAERLDAPHVPAELRNRNFEEVELAFSVEAATSEARRCLRCDLEFTRSEEDETACPASVGGAA